MGRSTCGRGDRTAACAWTSAASCVCAMHPARLTVQTVALCRASGLDEAHTKAVLRWLAAFHAACWGADAKQLGLWEQGCYWHLETRCGGGQTGSRAVPAAVHFGGATAAALACPAPTCHLCDPQARGA